MVITAILVLISILLIILLTSVVKLNAFVSLFIVSLLLALTTVPFASVVTVLKDGFGSTMASIGFLIIFGAIIAVVLDKSGGAIAIATAILRKTGTKNAAAAMGITGFVTGMPIFCDSGFIILSGLAKSFSAKTKIAMPFIAIVLATSLYSVHCLVPTHPGALAAAGLLKVDIGTLILVGTLFAFPAAIAAFYWVKWQTNSGQITHQEDLPNVESIEEQKLPPVFLSLLPIVIPLLLISLNSLLTAFGFKNQNGIIVALIFIGQPVIALFTGMLLSLFLIDFRKMETINGIFESAIVKAGPILIVTAAGGMFGMVIKETGVGAYAGEVLVKTGLGLAVPFLFAFLLKTAQGSSTVAIITASSFIAPMLSALGLDSETGKIMTMVVLGAGSMMISHANDSYFWVITRFSNIQTDTTLKIYSSATIVMGVTVFVCALVVSRMVL
jgi:GntP family gluconate:H+ symporter